tara:strand:+ start:769 stop:882 length:114 start_codon:yes stop_codon:yes gene_type:complete
MIDKVKSLISSVLVKLGLKKAPKIERKKKIRRKKSTK